MKNNKKYIKKNIHLINPILFLCFLFPLIDVFLTYVVVSNYGIAGEINPFGRFFMYNFGNLGFIFMYIFASLSLSILIIFVYHSLPFLYSLDKKWYKFRKKENKLPTFEKVVASNIKTWKVVLIAIYIVVIVNNFFWAFIF